MTISLGALLADVPHSRPVQIIGTASDPELIDRFELQRSRYEGPTGIVGVLHDALTTAGLAAASLWAAVPGYAAQVPSAKAALALLERACAVMAAVATGRRAGRCGREYDARVAAVIADDEDLIDYVTRLESMLDDDDEATSTTTTERGRRARRRTTPTSSSKRSSASSANRSIPVSVTRARSASEPDRSASDASSRGSRRRPSGPSSGRRRSPPAARPPPNQPTSEHSSGWWVSSPPTARQWNTQHVHAEAREAHALPVDDGQHPLGHALDAGLLGDLLDGDLGRRVPDVGPPGRVQPDPRVGPLHEQQLTVVVADDRRRSRPSA